MLAPVSGQENGHLTTSRGRTASEHSNEKSRSAACQQHAYHGDEWVRDIWTAARLATPDGSAHFVRWKLSRHDKANLLEPEWRPKRLVRHAVRHLAIPAEQRVQLRFGAPQ